MASVFSADNTAPPRQVHTSQGLRSTPAMANNAGDLLPLETPVSGLLQRPKTQSSNAYRHVPADRPCRPTLWLQTQLASETVVTSFQHRILSECSASPAAAAAAMAAVHTTAAAVLTRGWRPSSKLSQRSPSRPANSRGNVGGAIRNSGRPGQTSVARLDGVLVGAGMGPRVGAGPPTAGRASKFRARLPVGGEDLGKIDQAATISVGVGGAMRLNRGQALPTLASRTAKMQPRAASGSGGWGSKSHGSDLRPSGLGMVTG